MPPLDRPNTPTAAAGSAAGAAREEQIRLLCAPAPFTIFNALCVRPGRTATVGQLAAATRQSVHDVRHHLAALERVDAVEPTAGADDSDPSYRATADPLITDEEWALLPSDVRRRSFGVNLEVIQQQIWAAHAGGGFDAPDAHVSRVPASLDASGYRDVVSLLAATLERLMAIQGEVVERRAAGEDDGEAVRSDVVILHYGVPTGEDATVRVPDRGALRDDVCELSDDIADEIALDAADWERIAGRADALATLARRFAAAS